MRTAVAMEQLSKYVSAEANMHNNGGAMFSVQSVLRGYKKGQRRSFQGVEVQDASLLRYELGSRGNELRN
jgi:hypothetical protein